jgi:hypothetical protein
MKAPTKKIYVMVNDVAVKIGISDEPSKRAQAISSMVGSQMHVVYVKDVADAYAVERWAHHLLVPLCIAREWFDATLDEARRAVDHAVKIVTGTAEADDFQLIGKDEKCVCCKPTPVLEGLWIRCILDAKHRRFADQDAAQEIADEILANLDHYRMWSDSNYRSKRAVIIDNIQRKYGAPIDPLGKR